MDRELKLEGSTLTRTVVVAALVMGAASRARAQTPRLDAPIVVGSPADEDARQRELLGDSSRVSPLARSASGSMDRWPATGRTAMLLLPEARVISNSGFADGRNDGALWAGRGISALVRVGIAAQASIVRIVVLPELTYTSNRPFPTFAGRDSSRSAYASPWHVGRFSADLPLRFGDAPLVTVGPGQSSVTAVVGPVATGLSTEDEWWGPGIENALVVSNNAAGIPRAFVRTSRPLATPIGTIDARWELGVLTESPYFDRRSDDDYRSFAGALVTLTPRFDSHLTLGIEHTVVAPLTRVGNVASHVLDPITRWYGARTLANGAIADSTTGAPLFGLFGRWAFPGAGVEVYGEWTRGEFPRSIRDFMLAPQRSQGYTLGFGRATRLSHDRAVTVRLELTDLAQSTIVTDRPTPADYYTGVSPVQGYTQRGQIIGAAVGPGGTGGWLSVEYATPRWRTAAFVRRTRWENDAMYREVLPNSLRHDVSLQAGLHGTVLLRALEVRTELSFNDRTNYLFQNGVVNLDYVRTIDLHNLQLTFDVAPRRRAR